MDKTELDEIRARAEAATSGPWYVTRTTRKDGYNYHVRCLSIGYVVAGNVRPYERDAAFIAAARQDIPRLLDALEEERARNDLFSRCLHRALQLWKQQHPGANHWPDGADNIVWLLDEVERLRSVLEREREAANNLLSKLSAWGYKTAGQTLPSEIGQAIFEFEMERVGSQRDAR
jgi:hypothetical protein